jgi:hypothetical protein
MEPILNPLRHIGIHSTTSEPTKEKEMKLKSISVIVITAIMSMSLASVPVSALGTPKEQQKITWAWADGGDRGHRDFSEDDYDTVDELPTINVTVGPTKVSRQVILEKYSSTTKTWSAEHITRTDANGVAKLRINPLCDDEMSAYPMWCVHTDTFRIRVLKSGTQRPALSSQFVVSFVTSEEDTF